MGPDVRAWTYGLRGLPQLMRGCEGGWCLRFATLGNSRAHPNAGPVAWPLANQGHAHIGWPSFTLRQRAVRGRFGSLARLTAHGLDSRKGMKPVPPTAPVERHGLSRLRSHSHGSAGSPSDHNPWTVRVAQDLRRLPSASGTAASAGGARSAQSSCRFELSCSRVVSQLAFARSVRSRPPPAWPVLGPMWDATGPTGSDRRADLARSLAAV